MGRPDFLLLLLGVIASGRCHVVVPIQPVTARTALIWYHELHVLKGVPHDFGLMLGARSDDQCYYALVSRKIVRGVALCRRESLSILTVEGIACHPDYMQSGPVLLVEMRRKGARFDLRRLEVQKTWFMEALFLDGDSLASK